MTETCATCEGTGKCKGACENGWQAGVFPKRGCLICGGDGGITEEVQQGKGRCIKCNGTGVVEKPVLDF